jgi:GTP cyclohydrolase I
MRGAHATGSETVTTALLGSIRTDTALRDEFLTGPGHHRPAGIGKTCKQ